jgi:hypothetical protein
MAMGYLVILAPIVAAVIVAVLARREIIRIDAVAPITGAGAGVLMTVLSAVYLIIGAVTFEPEPAERPRFEMEGDLWISFPTGFAALRIGLLSSARALNRLRRLD